MKLILVASFIALCLARPDKLPREPIENELKSEDQIIFENSGVEDEKIFKKYIPKILRSENERNEDGTYFFMFETEDGVKREEYGTRIPNSENAIGKTGKYEYTLPNGQLFQLSFVADENGYQPISDFLPQSPPFPHPIPQFVLDQIENARREDEEAALRESEDHSFDDAESIEAL